ncbi:substrate-binding domain-containing protein [Kitasatospora sp. NPDC101183]|uniref:substrate-binding domain-containing protein n=1 Tax=Kitasatospora sp. NPDC101183 TaxID=3364100 RepID=UPI0038119B6C
MRRATTGLVGTVVLAALITMVPSGAAVADPAAGVTPNAVDIVGVGDGTSQILMNKLAAAYNASLTDPSAPHLYSWDVSPTGTITTKAGATPIARPANTYAGFLALNGNTRATVDFARSSRPAQTTDPSTDDFVALAKDAVTWAAPSTGNAPANLTTQNLKDIYTCAVTTWNQIDPTLSTDTIKPYLPWPQTGLGTDFLTAIGGGTSVTPGTCVAGVPVSNQGTDPAFGDPDALVPYSVGYFIGQAYLGQGGGADVQGPLTLRSIDSVAPVDLQSKTIAADFAATMYANILYSVVRDADWTATDAHGAALRAVLGHGSWICRNGADAIKASGFLPVSSFACGSVWHS